MLIDFGVTIILLALQSIYPITGEFTNKLHAIDEESTEENKTNNKTLIQERAKEEESSPLFLSNIKSTLKRVIKTYRTMKPEFKLAMCFSRYAGIVSEDSRAMKTKDDVKVKDKQKNSVLKDLLRGIFHTLMLFLMDVMPESMSSMMKTMTEMWSMTRDAYKVMRRDEMGGCSMDYMSNRFWWWLGTI